MKHLTLLFQSFFLLAFCLLLSSCEEKLNVKTFEPRLEIQPNDAVDGRDFYFRIYSETGRFVIDDIGIRDDGGEIAYSPDRSSNSFPFQGLTPGQEVTCDNTGWAQFNAPSVNIPKKTVYHLALTVSEPSTRNRVKLSGTFRGRTSLSVGEMDVNGFCKGDDVISDSTVLEASVLFSKPSFLLDRFHVPAGCSIIPGEFAPVEGKEYVLPDDRIWRFSLRCDGAGTDFADSLCVDVTDKDSGNATHIRYAKDILYRYPFNYTISCGNVDSDDGLLTLNIKTNRGSFIPRLLEVTADKPSELYCGSATLSGVQNNSFSDFFRPVFRDNPEAQLTVGSLCSFGEDDSRYRTLPFDAKGVSSVTDQKVRLRFILEDRETGKEEERNCEFPVFTSIIPADMELYYVDGNGKENVLGRCKGSDGAVSPVYVGWYDDSPAGQARGVREVRFRFLSDRNSIITSAWDYDVAVSNPTGSKLSVAGESMKDWGTALDGTTQEGTGSARLFFRGGSVPGEKKVTVSVYDPHAEGRISFSFPVYVRRRCAVVIDGEIYDNMGCAAIGDNVHDGMGWKGLVKEDGMFARVFEYKSGAAGDKDPLYAYANDHRNALTCADIENCVNFNPLPEEGSDGDISFTAEMKWSPGHASPCFYGALEKEHGKLVVHWWLKGGNHWDFPYAGPREDWPKTEGTGKSLNYTFSVNGGTADMEAAADAINYYCDNCTLACGKELFWKQTYDCKNDFYVDYPELKPMGKMSFSTRDVVWDKETLDIRYVVYRFKNNTNYWWHQFDEGVWYSEVADSFER